VLLKNVGRVFSVMRYNISLDIR